MAVLYLYEYGICLLFLHVKIRRLFQEGVGIGGGGGLALCDRANKIVVKNFGLIIYTTMKSSLEKSYHFQWGYLKMIFLGHIIWPSWWSVDKKFESHKVIYEYNNFSL